MMTERELTYGLNVALSNGDIFCREYERFEDAADAFYRMSHNPLCMACELVDKQDDTLAQWVAS